MPGSVNPKNGRICHQLFVDAQRRYQIEEFEEYEAESQFSISTGISRAKQFAVALPLGRQLPARFVRDLERHEKLRRLWTLESLPEFVKNGQHNGSNRDFSLALLLTWRGYKPEEIASVLLAAPYHKKFNRTEPYLRFTINRAFQTVEASRVKRIRVA